MARALAWFLAMGAGLTALVLWQWPPGPRALAASVWVGVLTPYFGPSWPEAQRAPGRTAGFFLLVPGVLVAGLSIGLPMDARLALAAQLSVMLGAAVSVGWALERWAQRPLGSEAACVLARWMVPVALGVLMALPLVLAPWVGTSTLGVADTLLAFSPLSHLAAAAQLDWLRFDAFYSRTPLAGLPVQYPAALPAGVAYLALAALLLAGGLRRRASSTL